MAESPSKRREAEENEDRMSSLPDSVLCHILSFLPTKTCVATSLVSRRWRHLWEYLQVLDLADDSYYFEDKEFELFRRFAVFVNAVLALRRSRDIRKMRLCCGFSDKDTFYADSIATWVRAAIGPRLEELTLVLFSSSQIRERKLFVIPSTIFTCTNLVSLRLAFRLERSQAVHLKVEHSSAVRLPSLKELLLNISYADADSVNHLLSGCPILESLTIRIAATDPSKKIRMPPSLKLLFFNVYQNCLDIDTPDLKYLNITQSKLGAIGNLQLQNVVEAHVDLSADTSLKILHLLQALSGTKHLVLSCSTTELLLCAPVLDFQEFRHLLHLELILPRFNSNLVVNVLQKCHMLQVVIIQNDKWQKYSSSLQSSGLQPTNVPICVVSHLTSIHFKGYQGTEDELAFAYYILRNGLVLKIMTIANISLDLSNKYSILKRLSDTPRGSAMCQLKFDFDQAP